MKTKLFDTAYLRLTGWYVLIIMTISLLFSVWVYNQARQELRVGLRREDAAAVYSLSPQDFRQFVEERLENSRNRLMARLIMLNGTVLLVGAGASYWLARRTLRPIEEAMEAQHRFTADASHELRTPLAAMKAEIEVGLRDKNLSKAEAVELLKSNLEEVDRLGTLSEGLLALTQTGSTPDLVPVPLAEVAGKVADRLEPLASAKKLSLRRKLDAVSVLADEASLDKVIGILLDNAIKYSLDNGEITLRSYKKDGHGYLTVKDQGVGIRSSELPYVFDRFYRADSSRTKARVSGHGLGLSIAQKIVEEMGGEISAASKPGQGSTFTIKLGASHAPKAPGLISNQPTPNKTG